MAGEACGAQADVRAWERAYGELHAFVREHAQTEARPGIVATPRSLSVPAELRAPFYERVGRAQAELGRAVLGGALDELAGTARACAAVRDGVVETSNLRELRLAAALEDCLADPVATAVRPLFSVVLDGVQGTLGAPELERRAREVLPAHVELLRRNVFEAHAYYGVVARLRPRTFYAVFSPDLKSVKAVRSDRIEVATQTSSPTLRLPEAVFETADGRVFAMKSEAAHELDFYGFKNKRRRDNSAGGATANLLTHRVLLLWRLPSVDDVDFVADRDRMRLMPTDLSCEVLAPDEMSVPAYVSAFVERINAVRSRRPVQVIATDARGDFPLGMLDDPTVAPVRVHRPGVPGEGDGSLEGILDEIVRALDE